MLSVMLDLETYGLAPDGAIKSIAAVRFDPQTGEVDRAGAFHVHVNLAKTSPEFRGTFEPSTIEWWLKQPHDAVRALIETPGADLCEALLRFGEWTYRNFGLEAQDSKTRCELWSNGPTFDEVLMRSAFQRCRIGEFPFHFKASRCMRTLYNLCKVRGGPYEEVGQVGTKHDALADALTQAERVCAMYRHLGLQT